MRQSTSLSQCVPLELQLLSFPWVQFTRTHHTYEVISEDQDPDRRHKNFMQAEMSMRDTGVDLNRITLRRATDTAVYAQLQYSRFHRCGHTHETRFTVAVLNSHGFTCSGIERSQVGWTCLNKLGLTSQVATAHHHCFLHSRVNTFYSVTYDDTQIFGSHFSLILQIFEIHIFIAYTSCCSKFEINGRAASPIRPLSLLLLCRSTYLDAKFHSGPADLCTQSVIGTLLTAMFCADAGRRNEWDAPVHFVPQPTGRHESGILVRETK